jgi:hypothetical protein
MWTAVESEKGVPPHHESHWEVVYQMFKTDPSWSMCLEGCHDATWHDHFNWTIYFLSLLPLVH